MCLEHYKRDASAVINAILENNLAPSLKSIDQNLPYIPPDTSEVNISYKEVLDLKNQFY